jgi:hypothetical protein
MPENRRFPIAKQSSANQTGRLSAARTAPKGKENAAV